ncbi:hypothetical protein [Amycolatopsis sp. NPDC004079]|uniref:hypothetical protein n=1 Tax=Amycolatopsis sp. NPDC004079 TaxID=3154549 RepID=UPI0033BB2580
MRLPGPLADRPRHRGLPVPYLAPFVDERMHGDERLRFEVAPDGTLGRIRYADEVPGDRDARGVLWIRVTSRPGRRRRTWGKSIRGGSGNAC